MRRWTTEERRKQSQAIRRWKPWESSTGALTNEGKAVSKMNAYKHGGRNAESREILRVIAQYRRLLSQVIGLEEHEQL